MNIRLMAPGQIPIIGINWKAFKALCSEVDQTDPASESYFQLVLSEFWFKNDRQGEKRFITGSIYYNGRSRPLSLINGRHRTRVLSYFMPVVPLAAHSDIYRRKFFESCIERVIPKDEYFNLPDLPIHSPAFLASLRTWETPNGS